MEPFRARVEEVYLVSRYRALSVAYAVSGTLVYLPSPRHRERAGRMQKDAGDYFCSFVCLAKIGLLQMPEHASPQDHLAHCGTLAREK